MVPGTAATARGRFGDRATLMALGAPREGSVAGVAHAERQRRPVDAPLAPLAGHDVNAAEPLDGEAAGPRGPVPLVRIHRARRRAGASGEQPPVGRAAAVDADAGPVTVGAGGRDPC